MKRRLTPQEKKSNRYDRDHVTLGWKTGTKWRKKWRTKEVLAERAYRHAWKATTHDLAGSADRDTAGPVPARKRLRKGGVTTVRDLVEHRKTKRAERHGAKVARRAAPSPLDGWEAERFLERLVRTKPAAEALPALRDLRAFLRAASVHLFPRRELERVLERNPSWMDRLREWRRKAWLEAARRTRPTRR